MFSCRCRSWYWYRICGYECCFNYNSNIIYFFLLFLPADAPTKKRTGNKWFAPCQDETCVQCIVLSNHVRNNEFVTLAVYIDDFNAVIILEMLAQLGDIDIHASGIEVIVVDPNGLQRIVAL